MIENTINLWLREGDKTLFEGLCKASLNDYENHILTGSLDNSGFLSKLGKRFVLGKEGIWIPKGTDQKYYFVRIKNNSMYKNGLVLTPYSGIDVKYHLGTKTIDQKTKLERVELQGMDTEDFVEWAFKTYYSPVVRRLSEKDQHFLLYSTNAK